MSDLQVKLDKQNLEEIDDMERRALLSELDDLYEIQNDLNQLIASQQSELDYAESTLEVTKINTDKGTDNMIEAKRFSFSKIPMVIGFVLGGAVGLAVGGPVGAVAGAKTLGLVGGGLGGVALGTGIGFASQ